jgi:hypothetical protein
MTWTKGTDSGDYLRRQTKTFIETWLATTAYKAMLPPKTHWKALLPGERQDVAVKVVINSEPDSENKPHIFVESSKQVNEEFHRIGVMVKSDKKSGGAGAASGFYAALNALFSAAMKEGTAECTARIAAGIYNLRVVPEGMEVDPGDNADEGTFYRQQLNLKCSTDTYLT